MRNLIGFLLILVALSPLLYGAWITKPNEDEDR